MVQSNQLKTDLYIKEDEENQGYVFLGASLYSFTNKYGSTAWLSAYEYKNDELMKLWDIEDLLLGGVIVKDYSKGALKLGMKGQDASFSIKLKQEEIKKIDEYLGALKDFKAEGFDVAIALPVEPKGEQEKLYRGSLNMYRELGFEEIEKDEDVYIMRLRLK